MSYPFPDRRSSDPGEDSIPRDDLAGRSHFESLLFLELHRKRAKNVAMMGQNMQYRESWLEDLVERQKITCSMLYDWSVWRRISFQGWIHGSLSFPCFSISPYIGHLFLSVRRMP